MLRQLIDDMPVLFFIAVVLILCVVEFEGF